MSGEHPEIGPELRELAQLILDRLDPALRAAAARAAAGGAARCQQVWCPVCALAALVAGEQHPLLNVIAEHSVALLAVIRALVEGQQPPGTGEPPEESPPDGSNGGPAEGGEPPPTGPGRYEPIPVRVED